MIKTLLGRVLVAGMLYITLTPASAQITITPENPSFTMTVGGATPPPLSVQVITSNGALWSSFDTSWAFDAHPTSGDNVTASVLFPSSGMQNAEVGSYSETITYSATGLPSVPIVVAIEITPPEPTPSPTPSPTPITIIGNSVTLEWDISPPLPDEPPVAGYRLRLGDNPGTFNQIYDTLTATTLILRDLNYFHIYYATAIAYNTIGQESDPSNELSMRFKPPLHGDTDPTPTPTPPIQPGTP